MEKFEFTNIYYRERGDEGGLQVVFVNKKQPKYALTYSLFELYYVSVLDTSFREFEEFTNEGKGYANTITGAANNDQSEEDMVIIKLANRHFIQFKWMEDPHDPEGVSQGLRLITEEYRSIEMSPGISMYDRIESLYEKGTDCPVWDLRL